MSRHRIRLAKSIQPLTIPARPWVKMSGDSYNLLRLRESIRPIRLHWFSRLKSTNDQAAHMRRSGMLYAPAVVLAGNQFAGRGRNNNSWWSDGGSITVTLVMPIHERLSPHQLPLIAGVALRNAVSQLTGEKDIELKWPNDLMFKGRKLAGVLCERVDRADLIGIGMNVNTDLAAAPAGLRRRLTSLSRISGQIFDKTEVLHAIVRGLHPLLSRRDEYPFQSILREYDRHHALRGRHVKVTIHSQPRPIRGFCQGLDGMGRLVVKNQLRQFKLVTGQVQVG